MDMTRAFKPDTMMDGAMSKETGYWMDTVCTVAMRLLPLAKTLAHRWTLPPRH